VRVLDPQEIENFDIETFNKCAKYHALMQDSVWKEMKEHLEEVSAEALRDMRTSLSSDPNVSHSLKLRWQQRDAVCKELINFVEGNAAYYQQKVQELNSQESEEWQHQ
jgi:hypothetical protein